MMVNQNFLKNGSNDFPDFWPEVGGQYSKKVDPAGFFSKNPVLLDLGLTVPKPIIFHVQGAKKSEKIFLGPKKVQKFQKFYFFDLNDYKSKKGQKTMKIFFSLLNWPDTWSFLAEK